MVKGEREVNSLDTSVSAALLGPLICALAVPNNTNKNEPVISAKDVPKDGKRITLFGATGKTGMIVMQNALKAG